MPKIKTHKATVKRFNINKKKKISHRKPGQDHFNARDTGDAGREKRTDSAVNKTYYKTIRTLIQK